MDILSLASPKIPNEAHGRGNRIAQDPEIEPFDPIATPVSRQSPLLAIDPGTNQSAWVVWNGNRILDHGIDANDLLLAKLRKPSNHGPVFIEMVASYGMPVGREVFETCLWVGRFTEASEMQNRTVHRVYRKDVKLHHCGSARAKDSNVRQALIDKYGAPGTKMNPGITYGLKRDLWSAFAIATFVTEKIAES